jgi:hypothetical protein
MSEKQFVEGLFVKRNDKAPEFVIANLSFNIKKFVDFLQAQEDERGWVNIDLKKSKAGVMYAEVNNWKPKQEIPVIEENTEPIKSFQEQLDEPVAEDAPIESYNDDVNMSEIKF